jgi:hypothetical protein
MARAPKKKAAVNTEPVNTEPVNTEPVNTEPVNTEPVKPVPIEIVVASATWATAVAVLGDDTVAKLVFCEGVRDSSLEIRGAVAIPRDLVGPLVRDLMTYLEQTNGART